MSQMVEKAKKLVRKHHANASHPEAVYQKLVDAGIDDEKVLASALLHHLPREVIETQVDTDVAKIVELYHHLAQLDIKQESPKNINHTYIVQTYMNLAQDMRVLVIALANQCHTIETAFALPQSDRVITAEKTLFLYAPIAKLLGLGDFTKTLENESFKILNPGEYARIKAIIEAKTPIAQRFFEEAVPVIADLLREQGISVIVTHRIKHVYSTYRKSFKFAKVAKNEADRINYVGDIAAMRIITNTVANVYTIESILKTLWEEIPELRDDNIVRPRPSGYRSLHNTFKIDQNLTMEVQTKTQEMHEEAEYGLCNHFFYKTGEKFKAELAKNPNWLKELNYFESYDKAAIKHFAGCVYAFTPKGDIIELPKGAKAIDFAYYLHTDLGNGCTGAKINGKLVKIDTEIKDGDTVEVLTDKNKLKPSKDWLTIVGTKKAKWEILKELRKGNF